MENVNKLEAGKRTWETGNNSEEMSAKGKEIKNKVKGSCNMTERQ